MLTKQIETAQKRVEAMNFETRKNVLRYDDVMNKQREIIYGQRRRVLMGEDVSESIKTMIYGTIDSIAIRSATRMRRAKAGISPRFRRRSAS